MNRETTMKDNQIRPTRLQIAMVGLCAVIFIVLAFAEKGLFIVSFLAACGLATVIGHTMRQRRWHPVRYALACEGFAMLTIRAWRDHKEGIAFVLAACSVLVGVVGLAKLRSGHDEQRVE